MDSVKPIISVSIRVILLLMNCILIGWILIYHRDWLLISNLIFILIIQVLLFARYQNRSWQKLNSVLSSLEENIETRNGFDSLRGELSKPVIDRLVRIENRFSALRLDIEKQNQFLQALVDNMHVGLIICDDHGTVELVNHMSLDLLQMRKINDLRQLESRFPELYESIQKLSKRQPIVQRLKQEQGTTIISLGLKNYRLLKKPLRIITLNIIQQELEEHEIDSWQKLIRVLTHEIMNSTGPISSTLDTLIEILTNEHSGMVKSVDDVKQVMLKDVLLGLHIIKDRSLGLAHFVQHFRNLTLLPAPVMQTIDLDNFFTRILLLIKQEINALKINAGFKISPDISSINADPALMEQVMINLLKNSMEALKNTTDPWIRIVVYQSVHNRKIIEIIDNGIGIPEEMLDHIFVPFFTTKENGSGIGLSLSRQIIRLHGGTIAVYSEPFTKTTFRISL